MKEAAEAVVKAGANRQTGKVVLLTEARRKKGGAAEPKNSSTALKQLISFALIVYRYLARGTALPAFFNWMDVYSKCPQVLVKGLRQSPDMLSTWFIGSPAAGNQRKQRKVNRNIGKGEVGEGIWHQEHGPVSVSMVCADGKTVLLCHKKNFSYRPAAGPAAAAESTGWCMHEIALALAQPEGTDQLVLRKVYKSNRTAPARADPKTSTADGSSSAGSIEVQGSDVEDGGSVYDELPGAGGDMSSPAPMPALSIGSASNTGKGKAAAVAEESRDGEKAAANDSNLFAAGVGESHLVRDRTAVFFILLVPFPRSMNNPTKKMCIRHCADRKERDRLRRRKISKHNR